MKGVWLTIDEFCVHGFPPNFSRPLREVGELPSPSHHKSSTLNPVCFAIRASIFGSISTRS
jgi:hypothetical protein